MNLREFPISPCRAKTYYPISPAVLDSILGVWRLGDSRAQSAQTIEDTLSSNEGPSGEHHENKPRVNRDQWQLFFFALFRRIVCLPYYYPCSSVTRWFSSCPASLCGFNIIIIIYQYSPAVANRYSFLFFLCLFFFSIFPPLPTQPCNILYFGLVQLFAMAWTKRSW